ncbi:serine/threonine-protein kinase phg2 [Condylostylus longicornis]|uniref:serine/threonine-protein kinase phg2 n=1 Tax=Condylostylus longicornis TaxID=2530218 RepID=UPI00244DE87B|nr:serine/threonine-protein kinase phg2 [Condylostylus longicornis]
MEIESGLTTMKYSDRIPPLDLSNVCSTVCSTRDNELRWNKMHSTYLQHQKQKNSKNIILNNKNNNNNDNNNNKINQNHLKSLIKSPSSTTQITTTRTTTINKTTSSSHFINYGSDGLPIDPRDWTRADVWKWLVNLSISEGIDVSPDLAQKFPMNGKALCLMSLDMYLSRVPIGGKMLYRDFRVRLAKAMSL